MGSLSKERLGNKRVCSLCYTRFYDLKKKPPVCPKCGHIIESNTDSRTLSEKKNRDELVLMHEGSSQFQSSQDDSFDGAEMDGSGADIENSFYINRKEEADIGDIKEDE